MFYITEKETEYKGKVDNISNETVAPTVTARNIDISNGVRKTSMTFAELFDITWGSDGIGHIEYSISGNLNFKNISITSKKINNLSDLEIGTYTITCKITSPSKKEATATKSNVNITKLAPTSVTNTSNNNVSAYAIYSEYDLAYFRDLVNNGQSNINAKLMNDITLAIVSATQNGGWLPIGYFDGVGYWTGPYFAGIFNGNGYSVTISSIADVTSASKHKEGALFGMIIGGRIENLTINGTIGSEATSGVAGIVGDIKDGTIYKCTNNATISGIDSSHHGGIAGTCMNSTIQECKNTGNIKGKAIVGGIVGWSYKNSRIDNCTNTGEVKCYGTFSESFYGTTLEMCHGGGITGRAMDQTQINSCSNEGNITVNSESLTANYVCLGGIVGQMHDRCNVSKSKNKGNIMYRIANNGLLGGIVGYSVDNSIVEQCYNTNTVYGRWNSTMGASASGGIVGWNDGSIIKNCYNIGSVEGNDSTGGIAGGSDMRFTSNIGYIYNCYSATLSITGNVYTGTFMGTLRDSEIKNCCFMTDTTYIARELSGIVWTSWKFLTIDEMKTSSSGLLDMLNSDDGTANDQQLWGQDSTKNSGLPYLVNNMP